MNKLTMVVLTLTLTACSGHIGTTVQVKGVGPMERIYHDNGGMARLEYQAWHDRANEHGYKGYIVDGSCTSFCVFMAFYSKYSCYTKNVRLGIHLGTHPILGRTDEVDEFNEKLLAGIPKPLADMIREVDNATVLGGRDVLFEELFEKWPEGYCARKAITIVE